MKIIVTHSSPDLDAITSVWLIKKFLPGWNEAKLKFVPAGQRLASSSEEKKLYANRYTLNAIERVGDDEVIHVDTGLGPLDHHQTKSDEISAASLMLDFIKKVQSLESGDWNIHEVKKEALERIIRVVVDIDHFKEVFWDNPIADYHEFSMIGILEGLKLQKPNKDKHYVKFISLCLDALLHNFENRIWAEKEIANAKRFKTKWGEGIGFETINDTVLSLAQKMGFAIVVRKDPRKGYVRIKARPPKRLASSSEEELTAKRYTLNVDIDLTPVYEKLRGMDSEATWFLHVSKKMLLNGSTKNPKMKVTKLTLEQIISVLESI